MLSSKSRSCFSAAPAWSAFRRRRLTGKAGLEAPLSRRHPLFLPLFLHHILNESAVLVIERPGQFSYNIFPILSEWLSPAFARRGQSGPAVSASIRAVQPPGPFPGCCFLCISPDDNKVLSEVFNRFHRDHQLVAGFVHINI